MDIESKIKKVFHRMIEEKSGDHTRRRFEMAADSVLETQRSQGRIDEDGVQRLKNFMELLLDEHFVEEDPEGFGEDENEEFNFDDE